MSRSYFRTQQDLVSLIQTSLGREPSVEEAHELEKRAWEIVELSSDKKIDDLIEIVREFGRWLDDGDIRLKDPRYAKLTTDRLRAWCELNRHDNP
jgi:hypothetical protein